MRNKLIEILRVPIYPHELADPAEVVADYLLDNGIVVLPCKIGDQVWAIKTHMRGQFVKKGVVYQMYFGDDMQLCICVKNVCRGEWGRNVFATKKEAEAAIANTEV